MTSIYNAVVIVLDQRTAVSFYIAVPATSRTVSFVPPWRKLNDCFYSG